MFWQYDVLALTIWVTVKQNTIFVFLNLLCTALLCSFIVEFPGFAKEGEQLLKSVAIKEGLTVVKYG